METKKNCKKVVSPWLVALGTAITVAVVVAVFLFNFNLATVAPAGEIISEVRPVADFNALDIATAGTVRITQGDQVALKITGDANTLPLIKTEVNSGKLKIYKDANWSGIFDAGKIELDITVTDLTAIKSSGSSYITTASQVLRADKLELDLSGSGRVDMAVITEEIKTIFSGSAEIVLRGQSDSQFLESSGSGQYFARDLVSRAATVSASGSLRAEVNAEQQLAVVISGSGSVGYLGTPKIEQKISGSGSVYRLE